MMLPRRPSCRTSLALALVIILLLPGCMTADTVSRSAADEAEPEVPAANPESAQWAAAGERDPGELVLAEKGDAGGPQHLGPAPEHVILAHYRNESSTRAGEPTTPWQDFGSAYWQDVIHNVTGLARRELEPLPGTALREAILQYLIALESRFDETEDERTGRTSENGGTESSLVRRARENRTFSLDKAVESAAYGLHAYAVPRTGPRMEAIAAQAPTVLQEMENLSRELSAVRESMAPENRYLLLPAQLVLARAMNGTGEGMQWSMSRNDSRSVAIDVVLLREAMNFTRALAAAAPSASEPPVPPLGADALWDRFQRLNGTPEWQLPKQHHPLVLHVLKKWPAYKPRVEFCLQQGWTECAHFYLIYSEHVARIQANALRFMPEDATARQAMLEDVQRVARNSSFFAVAYSAAFEEVPARPRSLFDPGRDYNYDPLLERTVEDWVVALHAEASDLGLLDEPPFTLA